MTNTPKMQRRHFQFVADAIASAPVANAARAKMAYEFAHRLRATNPQFDADRFVAACGINL